MSSKILSAAVVGLEAELVEVEADILNNPLGAFNITPISLSSQISKNIIK